MKGLASGSREIRTLDGPSGFRPIPACLLRTEVGVLDDLRREVARRATQVDPDLLEILYGEEIERQEQRVVNPTMLIESESDRKLLQDSSILSWLGFSRLHRVVDLLAVCTGSLLEPCTKGKVNEQVGLALLGRVDQVLLELQLPRRSSWGNQKVRLLTESYTYKYAEPLQPGMAVVLPETASGCLFCSSERTITLKKSRRVISTRLLNSLLHEVNRGLVEAYEARGSYGANRLLMRFGIEPSLGSFQQLSYTNLDWLRAKSKRLRIYQLMQLSSQQLCDRIQSTRRSSPNPESDANHLTEACADFLADFGLELGEPFTGEQIAAIRSAEPLTSKELAQYRKNGIT